MSLFVSNFNNYLTTMKIKQNYIANKSGIDEKKLSRILNGHQAQPVHFFLCDNFSSINNKIPQIPRISFYAGNPTKKQTDFANKLLDMMENIDEILSAKSRFLKMGF